MSEHDPWAGEWHVGRSWTTHDIEDACPCPKAPCGLVIPGQYDPECVQHTATRTIRQGHHASNCPATSPEPAKGGTR